MYGAMSPAGGFIGGAGPSAGAAPGAAARAHGSAATKEAAANNAPNRNAETLNRGTITPTECQPQ